MSPELRSQIHPTRLPKEFVLTVLKGKNGQDSRLGRVKERIPQTSEEYPAAIEANQPLRCPRSIQDIPKTTASRSAAEENAKIRQSKEEETIRKNWEAQIWQKYGQAYDQLQTQWRRATVINTEIDQWQKKKARIPRITGPDRMERNKINRNHIRPLMAGKYDLYVSYNQLYQEIPPIVRGFLMIPKMSEPPLPDF